MKKYLAFIAFCVLLASCKDKAPANVLPENYNPVEGKWEGMLEYGSEHDPHIKQVCEVLEFSADRKFTNTVVGYRDNDTQDTLNIQGYFVKDAPYKVDKDSLTFTTDLRSGGEKQQYAIVGDTLWLSSRAHYYLKIKAGE